MPSIKCECGNKLDFGRIPNPNEWLLISDCRYDDFSGQIDAEDLYSNFTHLLKCPNCGCFWIFWNGFQGEPTCYKAAHGSAGSNHSNTESQETRSVFNEEFNDVS